MQNITLAELISRYSQLPKRQRMAGALVVALMMVALDYFFVSQDQQVKLELVKQHLQQTESERAEKLAYAANLPLYETRLKELGDKLSSARAMLPDTANVPQFLSQIGSIAKDINLVIERFEPQPELPQDFYAESRFFVQARGSYHEIGMFLDRVSHMDRIVNVSDLTMDKPVVQDARVVLTATFLLKAYRSMSQKEMAAAKTAREEKK